MTPVEARSVIITQLQALFAAAERRPDIREHRGQFQSLDEIKNIALRSPSVLVSYRSFQQLERNGAELFCNVLWAIHIVANDTRAERRNELTSGLAIAICDHIAEFGNAWSFAESYANSLSAVDLSTLALDQNGLSLWQITWQQQCKFEIKDYSTLIDIFAGFDADHKAPGASDTDPPKAQTSETYPE